MYPSKYSWNWNSKDNGPNRDIVGFAGELRDAFDSIRGVKFGLYFSQFAFFHPLFLEDKSNWFSTNQYSIKVAQPQLRELVNKYKPEIVWSDGDWMVPESYWNSTNFLAWLYNESPVKNTVVTNDRWGWEMPCRHGGFYTCGDEFDPGTLQPHKWENAMPVDANSWGSRKTMISADVLPVRKLIEKLARTVSCGGNLLLNVGPTNYGIIDPLLEERLIEMGKWLHANGEAVYGTKPWIYQNDTITPDIWFTSTNSEDNPSGELFNRQTMNTVVYAWLLKWPKDGILLMGSTIPSNVTVVSMLGYSKPITFKLFTGGIKINLTEISYSHLPSQYSWVFKIQRLKVNLGASPKIAEKMADN